MAAATAAVPTYHVLGAGAMGCLFAASIARHGNKGLRAALLTRPRPRQRQEQQRKGAIRVTETYKGHGSEAADFDAEVRVEENGGGGSRPPIARVLVRT